jgi:hypothetical protein
MPCPFLDVPAIHTADDDLNVLYRNRDQQSADSYLMGLVTASIVLSCKNGGVPYCDALSAVLAFRWRWTPVRDGSLAQLFARRN